MGDKKVVVEIKLTPELKKELDTIREFLERIMEYLQEREKGFRGIPPKRANVSIDVGNS